MVVSKIDPARIFAAAEYVRRCSRAPGGTDDLSPRLSRRGYFPAGVAAAAIGTTAAAPVSAQDSDPYDGFFEDVENYEGTVDARGEDSVTVAVNGTFESELVEDAGTFPYVCTPQEALGMKGAIAVGDVIDNNELISGDTAVAGAVCDRAQIRPS